MLPWNQRPCNTCEVCRLFGIAVSVVSCIVDPCPDRQGSSRWSTAVYAAELCLLTGKADDVIHGLAGEPDLARGDEQPQQIFLSLLR